MHLPLPTTLLALAATAHADFWLSADHITGFGGPVGQTGNEWVFTQTLDCDDLIHASPLFRDSSDVSGDKQGVRVEWMTGGPGSGGWDGDQSPSVVEMHTDVWHRTWYYQQGQMVDLDNKVVGTCEVHMDTDKQCDVTAGVARFQSLLFCKEF